MGNTDSIPVISQFKSLGQVIGGDSEGAKETQENFFYRNTFPVLSQLVSAGHAIAGDLQTAEDVQIQFALDTERAVDAIPIVGHIKGGIHYAAGDSEGGEQALKASSRSVGVALGGIAGFVAGGPVGAFAGGAAGGVVSDGIISGVDLLANGGDSKPYGYVKTTLEIQKSKQENGSATGEQIATLVFTPIVDGIAGYTAGTVIGGPLGIGPGKATSIHSIPHETFRGADVRDKRV
jgi:hypothetical protein